MHTMQLFGERPTGLNKNFDQVILTDGEIRPQHKVACFATEVFNIF